MKNICTYVDKQRQVQMLIYMRWRLDNYWETRRGDIRTPSRNSPSLQNRKRLDSQKWMTWKILANCLNTVRPTQFQTWTIKAKKVHVNNSPLNYLFSVKGNLLVTASSLPKQISVTLANLWKVFKSLDILGHIWVTFENTGTHKLKISVRLRKMSAV